MSPPEANSCILWSLQRHMASYLAPRILILLSGWSGLMLTSEYTAHTLCGPSSPFSCCVMDIWALAHGLTPVAALRTHTYTCTENREPSASQKWSLIRRQHWMQHGQTSVLACLCATDSFFCPHFTMLIPPQSTLILPFSHLWFLL